MTARPMKRIRSDMAVAHDVGGSRLSAFATCLSTVAPSRTNRFHRPARPCIAIHARGNAKHSERTLPPVIVSVNSLIAGYHLACSSFDAVEPESQVQTDLDLQCLEADMKAEIDERRHVMWQATA